MNDKERTYKWMWMMEYCRSHGYPAAQIWAWERAEIAYGESHE